MTIITSFLRGPKRNRFASIIIHSLPFIPLWIFLLLPYYQLHISLPEATRSIRDAAHFSLGLDQIFTFYHSWTVIVMFIFSLVIHQFSSLRLPAVEGGVNPTRQSLIMKSNKRQLNRNGGDCFSSITRFAMTKITAFLRSSKHFVTKTWGIILLFSTVMSLGPVLKIFGQNLRIFGFPIPLPYALFYYLFPGFTGFRTPSRFIVLTLLSSVIIIGVQLKPIFEKLKPKTKLTLILLILSLLFVEADLPLKGYPININMHPVYQEVMNLPPDAVILELPIKLWNMPDHEIESIRSLYSLFHNHRRFGGFSGFATNHWIDLVNQINTNGLTRANISSLKSLGVTHVIKDNQLLPLH